MAIRCVLFFGIPSSESLNDFFFVKQQQRKIVILMILFSVVEIFYFDVVSVRCKRPSHVISELFFKNHAIDYFFRFRSLCLVTFFERTIEMTSVEMKEKPSCLYKTFWIVIESFLELELLMLASVVP